VTVPFRPCELCAHYLGKGTCEAFPEGIPKKIISWEHDHRFPFEGDQGIRFTARGQTQDQTD